MRVIAGSARRRSLICPAGNHTRPTTDRIKETLFNILSGELYDIRFLDLFSGSGGIGIEALSRGGRECVFVEKDREALRCIRENISRTGFEDKSHVMAMDVMRALGKLEAFGQPFEVIFMDPPYRQGWEEKIVSFLLTSSLVREDTLLVIETALDTDVSYMRELTGCQVERIKEYKTNRHVFLRVVRQEA